MCRIWDLGIKSGDTMDFAISFNPGGGGGGGGHSGTEWGAYAHYQNLKIPLKHWFLAKKAPLFW